MKLIIEIDDATASALVDTDGNKLGANLPIYIQQELNNFFYLPVNEPGGFKVEKTS